MCVCMCDVCVSVCVHVKIEWSDVQETYQGPVHRLWSALDKEVRVCVYACVVCMCVWVRICARVHVEIEHFDVQETYQGPVHRLWSALDKKMRLCV